MRKFIYSVALAGSLLASGVAMAGKESPVGLAGSGATGALIGNEAVAAVISNTINTVFGGSPSAYIAAISATPGVTVSGGTASFALNVDGVAYNITVSQDGNVTAEPRA